MVFKCSYFWCTIFYLLLRLNTREGGKHFWIIAIYACSYCCPYFIVTFSPFFIFELKFLYFLIFLMILWFFILISLNLLFQELPKAKLRFSQRSCIEDLSMVAEILQWMRSWKWGFTVKCFRPLCVLVWHPFDLCVAFHQTLKSNLRRRVLYQCKCKSEWENRSILCGAWNRKI